jgi:bifunctional non-homologous end joining protein LigD
MALPVRAQHSSLPAAQRDLRPMLATVGSDLPVGPLWTFEPKYDGIRVLVVAAGGEVALISRNGNDKSAQFPEIVDAVRALAARRRRALVLDGEIVGLRHGQLGRFQDIQHRIHRREHRVDVSTDTSAVTLVVFDLLIDGDEILVRQPWTSRRRRLEQLLGSSAHPGRGHRAGVLRLGATSPHGDRMLAEGRRRGWEGVIAKRVDAPYDIGHRSDAWRKLKLEHEQEFVVGGDTEPRNTRPYLGALLLSYYTAKNDLVYAGLCGGGFTRAELRAVYERLQPLTRRASPFAGPAPVTRETRHWVEPRLVVQVRFTEWTADGKLRHPVYLGVRDDVDPSQVRREAESPLQRRNGRRSSHHLSSRHRASAGLQPFDARHARTT